MQKSALVSHLLTITAAGIFVASCGPTPLPPPPVPSPFTSIQVVGPATLNASESAQFVANVSLADGTTTSATSMPNLKWRSSNPAVMWVSDSGLVTAAPSSFGLAAVITAESTANTSVNGTRQVAIRPKAVVTGGLKVSEQVTAGTFSYAFVLELTESAGVSATITGLQATFDDGSGLPCSWTPDKLSQTRLTAGGKLALESLTCDFKNWPAFEIEVVVQLKDDNGYNFSMFVEAQVR